MTPPLPLKHSCLNALVLAATLTLISLGSAAASELESVGSDPEIADATELAALSNRFASLERRFSTRLEMRLGTLADRMIDAQMDRVDSDRTLPSPAPAAAASSVRDSSTSALEPIHEVEAVDRSWKIVITRVPQDATPAAPIR